MTEKINSPASLLHQPSPCTNIVTSFVWRYRFPVRLAGDTAHVDLCSPQRTSKTKMHHSSCRVFRSNLNYFMTNIAILMLLCFTTKVRSGGIPHLQRCVVQILTKGTCVSPDAFSALLQIFFF